MRLQTQSPLRLARAQRAGLFARLNRAFTGIKAVRCGSPISDRRVRPEPQGTPCADRPGEAQCLVVPGVCLYGAGSRRLAARPRFPLAGGQRGRGR